MIADSGLIATRALENVPRTEYVAENMPSPCRDTNRSPMIGIPPSSEFTPNEGTSTGAHVRVNFDYMIKRRSLKSAHSGWRSYPVYMAGTLDEKGVRLETGVRVTYSSTCPCSAALARQLNSSASSGAAVSATAWATTATT